MSKILFICTRNQIDEKANNASYDKLNRISRKVIPDNITPNPTNIIANGTIKAAIYNPVDTLSVNENGICMGNILGNNKDWWKTSFVKPVGTYALFRWDDKCVKIDSDIVGSRTIWYFKNDNIFIVSTSQRAIINYLGNFTFNKNVIPWVLSTGTLGPDLSWDTRIKFISPNSTLILKRDNWNLDVLSNEAEFKEETYSDQESCDILKEILIRSFECTKLDSEKWVLPLSGGYDSRAILLFLLKQGNILRTITWGIEKSLHDKKNDAYIAKTLAGELNVEHEYFVTDKANENIVTILDRVLIAGEGRIDAIGAYMDGFKIWKTLFENKICAIVRGDEGFGWDNVSNEKELRRVLGMSLITDYENTKQFESLLSKQEIPENLNRNIDESLEMWRDRLYHEFRIPYVLAALSDMKLPYVEIMNPLLNREIILCVRKMKDSLRTNKKAFRDIVNSISPKIPYAKYSAIAQSKNILKSKEVVENILKALNTKLAEHLLPQELLGYIKSNMKNIEAHASTYQKKSRAVKETLRRILGKQVKRLVKNYVIKSNLDVNILAFRAYIIVRMHEILLSDLK